MNREVSGPEGRRREDAIISGSIGDVDTREEEIG